MRAAPLHGTMLTRGTAAACPRVVYIKFWRACGRLCSCFDQLSTNGKYRTICKPAPVRPELVEGGTAEVPCSLN
jgi:hypothetical protein